MALDLPRIGFLVVWGGGTLWFFGRTLLKRHRSWRKHRDARAFRDLMAGVSLFLVALCSSMATLFVLFGPAGTGLRGFMVALALGAFLAAGFVMSGEEDAAAEIEQDSPRGRRRDEEDRLARAVAP